MNTKRIMKLSMFKNILLLCIFWPFLGAGSLAEELRASVVWEKEYVLTPPGGQGLLLCQNGDILFGRIDPEGGGLIIRKLSTRGELLWENTFKKVEHIVIDGKVKGIVEDLAGNVYVGVDSSENGIFFFKISSSGQLLVGKSFYQDFYNNKSAELSKLVIRDGSIYALGQLGRHDAWLCKLTPEGFKSLEMRYNVGKQDLVQVTGALVNRKGELLVILESGQFDKFGGGPSLVKVMKLNEDSKQLDLVTSFKGKKGSICQLSSGRYAIAFDGSPIFPQQDIRLKLFNEDFEQQSEAALYKNKIGGSLTYVSPYKEDSFLVAGVKDYRQVVTIINSKGEVVTEKIFPTDQVYFIEGFLTGKKVFVSVYMYTDDIRQDPEMKPKNKLVIYSRE